MLTDIVKYLKNCQLERQYKIWKTYCLLKVIGFLLQMKKTIKQSDFTLFYYINKRFQFYLNKE